MPDHFKDALTKVNEARVVYTRTWAAALEQTAARGESPDLQRIPQPEWDALVKTVREARSVRARRPMRTHGRRCKYEQVFSPYIGRMSLKRSRTGFVARTK